MDQSSIWFAATKAFGTDDLQIVKVKSDWFVFSDRGTFSAHSQNGRIAFTASDADAQKIADDE